MGLKNVAVAETNVRKWFDSHGHARDCEVEFRTLDQKTDKRHTVALAHHHKEYDSRVGTVWMHVVSARALPDRDGQDGGKQMRNPYCKVTLVDKDGKNGTSLHTNTVKGNLEPSWEEVFTMPLHDVESKLEVAAYDDEFGTDTLLGGVGVGLADMSEDASDQWYDFRIQADDSPNGLVSLMDSRESAGMTKTPAVRIRLKYAPKDREEYLLKLWHQEDFNAGRVKDKTHTYRLRTLSNEIKYGWLHALHWAMQQCPGGVAELTKSSNSGTTRMPPPPLLPRDATRAAHNPTEIDLPFSRLRQLLYNLNRFKCLSVSSNRAWKFYTMFQIEMYATKLHFEARAKKLNDRSPQELGSNSHGR